MRVLLAFDKFKDCLTAPAACTLAAAALRERHPDWTLDACPLADGGAEALRAMTEFARKYGLVMVGVVILVMLLIQLPLRRVIGPIRELVSLSKEVARGNLKVQTRNKGFGEVQTLLTSFSTMSVNLVHREQSIRTLMLEQQEKIRMERELSVAKSVQDNLLPKNPLPEESGLTLGAAYVPAAQVAGDWFTYDFSPETGETVVVVVDVSGHDMAASMFTAIVAGLFFEVREAFPGRFPAEAFAAKAGRRIRGFGRGQWHATIQVARYVKGGRTIEITNCGHTFPMLLVGKSGNDSAGSTVSSRIMRLPSNPVGVIEGYEGVTSEFPFEPGATLLMYTDGVTDTRDPSGKIYGQKRLFKVGQDNVHRSTKQLVHLIHRDCLKFRGSLPTQDDLCLVALRLKESDA